MANELIKELNEVVQELMEYNHELFDALKALVEKLEEIHDNPNYQGVWSMAHAHGHKYNGPTYEEELKKAKKLVEEANNE